jgi:hypothetical protein
MPSIMGNSNIDHGVWKGSSKQYTNDLFFQICLEEYAFEWEMTIGMAVPSVRAKVAH